MSEYVDGKIANEASEKGKLLGKTEPMAETKYTWWEAYKTKSDIIACVCEDSGISCGERISIDEIGMYVDDTEEAKTIYDQT